MKILDRIRAEIHFRRAVRADWERRVRYHRLRYAGWSEDEYRAALRCAARAWAGRFPWRLVPAGIRAALYPRLGRRFTALYLARWRAAARAQE